MSCIGPYSITGHSLVRQPTMQSMWQPMMPKYDKDVPWRWEGHGFYIKKVKYQIRYDTMSCPL